MPVNKPEIELDLGKNSVFNYSLYNRGISPINGLRIRNNTADPIGNLWIRVCCDQPLFKEQSFTISSEIPPVGKWIPLPYSPAIEGNWLVNLDESVPAQITIELFQGQNLCVTKTKKIDVLTYDQYAGDDYIETLTAFVQPNHLYVVDLHKDVSRWLGIFEKNGWDDFGTSLEGYQSDDPNRVRRIIAACYYAIREKNIEYNNPPANFNTGQRIRMAEEIFGNRIGTCMDMTLLFASLLESVGLNPVLVLIKGHIFAGVWLNETDFGEIIINNPDRLLKEPGLLFVECTDMCKSKNYEFEQAEKDGRRNLEDAAKRKTFEKAIDVRFSRNNIKPMPYRRKQGLVIEHNGRAEDEEINAIQSIDIPILKNAGVVSGKAITDKVELWESKLLELGSGNKLVNLTHGTTILPIMSCHIEEMENLIADGNEFDLLPAEGKIYAVVDDHGKLYQKEYKLGVFFEERKKDDRFIFEFVNNDSEAVIPMLQKVRSEVQSKRLHTFWMEKTTGSSIKTILRKSKEAEREYGINSLYMAMGLLRYYNENDETGSSGSLYAPLILMPVSIEVKPGNDGYVLKRQDEDAHFNITLLELLRNKFNLGIQGLDPLPPDEHGLNISTIFAIVRNAIKDMPGWDVVETAVIGIFDSAKIAMWQDIHASHALLENSKIIKGLIQGKLEEGINAGITGLSEKTYTPISLDATQLESVKMASIGKTFVLHGPPGTGKSQTITAMIGNALALGKTVLFVAEKATALNVVQRRLADTLGIGDFCLELDAEMTKGAFLGHLNKTLQLAGTKLPETYSKIAEANAEKEEDLNRYSEHLHCVRKCGKSVRQLMDLYDLETTDEFVPFDRHEVEKYTADDLKKHEPLICRLVSTGNGLSESALWLRSYIGLAVWNTEVNDRLSGTLRGYGSALERALESGTEAARILELDSPGSFRQLETIDHLISQTRETDWTVHTEPQPILEADPQIVESYFDERMILEAKRNEALKIWIPDFLEQDVREFQARLESAEKNMLKALKISSLKKELQQSAVIPLPSDVASALQTVAEVQTEDRKLKEIKANCTAETRAVLDEFKTKQEFREAYEAALEIRAKTEEQKKNAEKRNAILHSEETTALFDCFRENYRTLLREKQVFDDLIVRKNPEAPAELSEEINLRAMIRENNSAFKKLVIYNGICEECKNAGLETVIEKYEAGMTDEKALISAYRRGMYFALIKSIIMTDDVLLNFTGDLNQTEIQNYRELDETLKKRTKNEIYRLLVSRIPMDSESAQISAELTVLRKAISSGGRAISVRDLLEKTKTILPRLAPCFLMSPETVAQYLRQENGLFDLVIFDEASQLPTCRAIGALMRGKSAVIVGDPKQMPPTSFFSGGGVKVADASMDDLDSILDDALALGIDSRYLKWHYRSSHESLIAFSNQWFYENKMFTYPSANDLEQRVKLINVNGHYRDMTNQDEAVAIVLEIIRRYREERILREIDKEEGREDKFSSDTIGVIAFNEKQQKVIEALLEKQCAKDDGLNRWVHQVDPADKRQKVEIKALEKVQGDEWSSVFFSINYGPDKKGIVRQMFGPITREGGGKRLNVAFSRAKKEILVFTGLHPGDIALTEKTSEGVRAFRGFLEFAASQTPEKRAKSENETKILQGMVRRICSALEAEGYQCRADIGHSDFRVDIGVVDPNDPERYILGILLDGDTYRMTKDTHDREVGQPSALEKNFGWDLIRIWAIDWWDNREEVISGLLEQLEALKTKSREKAEKEQLVRERCRIEAEKYAAEDEALRESLCRDFEEAEKEEKDSDDGKAESVEIWTTTDDGGLFIQVEDKPKDPPQEEEKSDEASESADTHPEEETKPDPDGKPETVPPTDVTPEPAGKPVPETQDKPEGDLLELLRNAGVEIIDKRANGGALWIIGGKELKSLVEQCKMIGVHFFFKAGGGKATGKRDGWWSQTTLPLTEKASQPGKPSETPVAAEEQPKAEEILAEVQPVEAETEPDSETGAVVSQKWTLEAYQSAEMPVTPLDVEAFLDRSNRVELQRRLRLIADAEGPILKETLIRKVLASYDKAQSSKAFDEADKQIKAAKIQTTKLKGVYYCWADGQDPQTWSAIRVTSDRKAYDLTPYEIRNAACYVIMKDGPQEKEELPKKISQLFGYKHLGTNLDEAIRNGIRFARESKAIFINDGKKLEINRE